MACGLDVSATTQHLQGEVYGRTQSNNGRLISLTHLTSNWHPGRSVLFRIPSGALRRLMYTETSASRSESMRTGRWSGMSWLSMIMMPRSISCGFKEFEVFPLLWDDANPCQIYAMSLK